MINKIHVIGRQTEDPKQSVVSGVSCTNFGLASDTRNKDGDGNFITNFYRVSAWRTIGDTCAKYLHKGDRVSILGDLLLRTYTDKNGQERSAMQITLTDIDFINDRRADSSDTQTASRHAKTPENKQTPSQNIAEVDNDELPF